MNAYYVQYDQQTGQIYSSGSTSIESIEGVPGYLIVDGVIDNTMFKVQDNQIVALPLKPGVYYYYDYTTDQWVYDEQVNANIVTNQRNDLLYACDWTQIPNNPLTSEQQEAWAIYRQELRDVPSQPGFPANVIWPTPPQG
jgi:hypothetical protein